MKILIVRLGALGDIVHTVPAAAALRRALPQARIDWVVDARHAPFASLIVGLDRVVQLANPSPGAWARLVSDLRRERYDVALDFQGLLKSAVLARASGARRVIGFPVRHLREKTARPFYSEVEPLDGPAHVIWKNLRLLSRLGVNADAIEFPLGRPASPARDAVRAGAGQRPIALVNPGAAWPNKRWSAARFGQVCRFLRGARGMQPYVLWGPDERELAESVVEASDGAAAMSPPTTTPDLLELSRDAALIVSGDTGPLHIAAAVGTPAVAIFGPTDPARNGPWAADDVCVSRYSACGCSYRRRCRRTAWCLDEVTTAEVIGAIERRIGRSVPRPADSAGPP